MKQLTLILLLLLGNNVVHAKDIAQPARGSRELLFIENRGQITDQDRHLRKDIDFRLEGQGITIFGGSAQLHYQWLHTTGSPKDSNMQTETYRMDVVLLGANTKVVPEKEEAQPYYENYYYPHCKDGVTAHSYRRMVYKNIYPQIDWVIYTKGAELKYDFIVHKGGNPANIRLQYNGAVNTVLKAGVFTATTPFGSITEDAPYSYEAGSNKKVKSAYVLKGNILSFDVRKREADLVIDPNIVWATYYGGSANDFGNSVVADDSNKVYLSGVTNSANNIATVGAWRTSLSSTGYWDRFLTCITEAGVRQWGTYINWNTYNGTYSGNNIAIDTVRDCLYLGGTTSDSSGIATVGAHQTVFGGGGSDNYLQKFNLNGFRVWATYYGGEKGEYETADVTTDEAGNVYMFGETTSITNIVTVGAYMSTSPFGNGTAVGYIVKFNALGVRQWATYLCLNNGYGGGGYGSGDLMKTAKNGDVYIAGTPISSCAAGTIGTHRAAPIGTSGNRDVWLGKFTSAGNFLWGTFYGGTNHDWPEAISVADNGDVYIAGTTQSDTGITTPGSFRATKYPGSSGGREEGFLARFDGLGRRMWGTYLADSLSGNFGGTWEGCHVAVSGEGKIYVVKSTLVPNVPWPNELVTPNGFQTNRGNYADLVVGMFDTSGKHLWGSFLGGSGYEGEFGGGTVGKSGITLTDKYLYIGSSTTSTSGLVGGVGAIHQTTFAGAWDAFIAQISLDTIVRIRQPFTDTVFCPGDTFRVKYKTNFPFRSGNVFTVQLSNASGSFASPTVIGTKTATTSDSITYVIPRTAAAGNGYRLRVIASAPADTSPDNAVNMRIKPLPVSVQASSNSPVCATDTLRLSGSSASTDVTWNWTGVAGYTSAMKDTFRAATLTAHSGIYILTVNRNGCIVKDTINVVIKPRPDTPDANSNSPVCPGDIINLSGSSATTGVVYSWTGPSGFSSSLQNPSRPGAVAAYAGIYRVSTNLNGCASLFYDSTVVVVHPVTPTPSANANTPICIGQDLQLGASTIAGATYSWTGATGFTSGIENPIRPSATTAFAGKYYVTATVNGCVSPRDSVTVSVNPAPVITMYPSPKDTICVGNTVNFVSSISNTGSSYIRSWYKNNNVIGGAANASYSTSTAADKDEYYATVTVYGVCATPYTDTSNVVKMTVLPWLAPVVSITANPTTTVPSGTMINFNATPTNGGNTPKYQWTRNGANITGALSNLWGASTLSNNDVICVEMTSSYLCPNPKTAKSNCIKVSIESTGIANTWKEKTPSIYPNPTKDKLIIEGIAKDTKIQLNDVLGRAVISTTSTTEITELNMGHLASGNYILQLSTADGDRMTVKVVKE